MISKHRNRGFLQLAIAVVLTVVSVLLIRRAMPHFRLHRAGDGWLLLLIPLSLGTVTLWSMSGFTLAKAKGYHPDMLGPVFVFLYIVGLCFPVVFFGFPLFVILGLKDKTLPRKRRRHGSGTRSTI
jgi:hypothetical protein